jgi:Phosphopantetheine attachment site
VPNNPLSDEVIPLTISELERGDLITQVRLAWAEILDTTSVDDVPTDVNFLEAGGNSLLLVMLWEALQPLATRPLKLSDLFNHGTVRAQARLLAAPAAEQRPSSDTGSGSLLAARRAVADGTMS